MSRSRKSTPEIPCAAWFYQGAGDRVHLSLEGVMVLRIVMKMRGQKQSYLRDLLGFKDDVVFSNLLAGHVAMSPRARCRLIAYITEPSTTFPTVR